MQCQLTHHVTSNEHEQDRLAKWIATILTYHNGERKDDDFCLGVLASISQTSFQGKNVGFDYTLLEPAMSYPIGFLCVLCTSGNDCSRCVCVCFSC
jgi:hypothetical protein